MIGALRWFRPIPAQMTLFATAGLAEPALAQEPFTPRPADILLECLRDGSDDAGLSDCFGLVVDICITRFPDDPIVPAECWREELAGWDDLLNAAYQDLIADVRVRGYADFEEPIRAAQRHWLEQMALDCALTVMSSPQTYENSAIACEAGFKRDRWFFLHHMIGADWAPLRR